jgi:predicted phosphodiesterase
VVNNISLIKESVSNFINSIYTEEISDKTNEIIINSTSEKICEKIKSQIIEKFGFEENDVYVSLDLSEENQQNIKINKINIILTHKASWSDTDKVSDYIKNLVGCDVYVTKK